MSTTEVRRMQPNQNRVLARMRAGKVALSCSLTPVCSPKVAELIGLIGFDCLWIDMEHQDFDYDQVANACLACRATSMEPMVRIRREGRHSAARAFEAGATGIMVPHCMDGEDARAIVRNARFAPLGLRGIDGVEPLAAHGLMPLQDYLCWSNQETFVLLQIEDKEAVEAIDDIAAVPGVDILFIGPGDLSQSYGAPGDTGQPEVQQAVRRVAQAAARHGKFWGGPAGDPDRAREWIGMGALFLNTTSLSAVMRRGFDDAFRSFDDLRRSVDR
jgi:4-hydroxy-2-oxoheptanedioate aldolase